MFVDCVVVNRFNWEDRVTFVNEELQKVSTINIDQIKPRLRDEFDILCVDQAKPD